MSQDVIEKQANARIKECGSQSQDNIVAVHEIRELRNMRYCFIDMELCDLNLSQ